MAPISQRQSTRYELSAHHDSFSCSVTDKEHTRGVVDAHLNNISVGGVQLTLPYRVKNGHPLSLRLQSPSSTRVVGCVVRWTVPDNKGWVAGCQFDEALEQEFLDDLARSGILERRGHQRFEVALACRLRGEGGTSEQGGWIRDYSNGGLRVEVPARIEPGGKAMVSLVDEDGEVHRMIVFTQWCEGNTGAYQVGLRFLNDNAAFMFLNCVESLDAR